jgi:hypothetical protein
MKFPCTRHHRITVLERLEAENEQLVLKIGQLKTSAVQ